MVLVGPLEVVLIHLLEQIFLAAYINLCCYDILDLFELFLDVYIFIFIIVQGYFLRIAFPLS